MDGKVEKLPPFMQGFEKIVNHFLLIFSASLILFGRKKSFLF